jgi:hypothetical protein
MKIPQQFFTHRTMLNGHSLKPFWIIKKWVNYGAKITALPNAGWRKECNFARIATIDQN